MLGGQLLLGWGGQRDQPAGEDARRRERNKALAIPVCSSGHSRAHTHGGGGTPCISGGQGWCVGSGNKDHVSGDWGG